MTSTTATTENDNQNELYRINDVLGSLANELGVPITPDWEDEVLNDLVLSVAQAFRAQRETTAVPKPSSYIKNRTNSTLLAIARHRPGAWEATRGKNYADMPDDVKAFARALQLNHGLKLALMFLNMHGLDAVTMDAESSQDLTGGTTDVITVPDFSEYSEAALVEFLNLMDDLNVITPETRDEVLYTD